MFRMINDGKLRREWVSFAAALVAVLALSLGSGSATADMMLGPFDGNDNLDDVAAALLGEGLIDSVDEVCFWTKFDDLQEDADFNDPDEDDYAITQDGITIQATEWKDGEEAIAGTWMSDEPMVWVVTPKAGSAYALYIGDAESDSGTWSTDDLDGKGISHLSFYKIKGNIIPEPASFALVGLGGLALLRRRRRA